VLASSPGSIPSQRPRHTKDVIKLVPVVPVFSTFNEKYWPCLAHLMRNTGSFSRFKILTKKWWPSWMLSWFPWKPPGYLMSTIAKNKLQTSSNTIQTRNALDKKCTQITPGTVLPTNVFGWGITKAFKSYSCNYCLPMFLFHVFYDLGKSYELMSYVT